MKGTDSVVEEARRRGAEPRAPGRALEALESVRDASVDLELLTYGRAMGAEEAHNADFDATVVGEPGSDETTAEDTRDAVKLFVEQGVDLVVFVGGDGTAADVADVLDELEAETPVLGVPAGVKIYSPVFLECPGDFGAALEAFAASGETARREVNDVDEEEFREGRVRTELRGVVNVPVSSELQQSKQSMEGDVEAAVQGFLEDMESGVAYVLGPGTTLLGVKEALGFTGTSLGVDVWRDGDVIADDAGEQEILEALGDRNVVAVSPIGGQGFVFGRGNQQISPDVIRRSEVEVLASRSKLQDLDALRVDTGDSELDDELRGWMRVRVGRTEWRLMRVE